MRSVFGWPMVVLWVMACFGTAGPTNGIERMDEAALGSVFGRQVLVPDVDPASMAYCGSTWWYCWEDPPSPCDVAVGPPTLKACVKGGQTYYYVDFSGQVDCDTDLDWYPSPWPQSLFLKLSNRDSYHRCGSGTVQCNQEIFICAWLDGYVSSDDCDALENRVPVHAYQVRCTD